MFNIREAKSKIPGAEQHYGEYLNGYHNLDDAIKFADKQSVSVVVIRGNLCEVYRNKP